MIPSPGWWPQAWDRHLLTSLSVRGAKDCASSDILLGFFKCLVPSLSSFLQSQDRQTASVLADSRAPGEALSFLASYSHIRLLPHAGPLCAAPGAQGQGLCNDSPSIRSTEHVCSDLGSLSGEWSVWVSVNMVSFSWG